MTKSIVIGVSAEIDPQSNGRVVATFYRFQAGRHPAYSDWMQPHTNLTVASCKRLWRILDRGDVSIKPDQVSIYRDFNQDKWFDSLHPWPKEGETDDE